ncbi:MAG: hypothetical protein R3D71_02100 [Rickettsiales bacterium]
MSYKLRIIFLLLIAIMSSGYRWRCYFLCDEQTAIQNDYVEMRDNCRSEAQDNLQAALKKITTNISKREQKKQLVALFSDCMARHGWDIPSGIKKTTKQQLAKNGGQAGNAARSAAVLPITNNGDNKQERKTPVENNKRKTTQESKSVTKKQEKEIQKSQNDREKDKDTQRLITTANNNQNNNQADNQQNNVRKQPAVTKKRKENTTRQTTSTQNQQGRKITNATEQQPIIVSKADSSNDRRPLTTAERKQQNQQQEARRLSQYSPAAGGRDNKTARSSADKSKDSLKDNETHVISGESKSDIVHRQPRITKDNRNNVKQNNSDKQRIENSRNTVTAKRGEQKTPRQASNKQQKSDRENQPVYQPIIAGQRYVDDNNNDRRPLTTAERRRQNQQQEARRLSQYSPAAGGRDNGTSRSNADRNRDSFKDNETRVVSDERRSDIVNRQPRVVKKVKTNDDSSDIIATNKSINEDTKAREKQIQILANNTGSKQNDLTNKNRDRDETISTRDEKRKQDAAKQSSGRQQQRENIKQSKIVQYQPIIAGQQRINDNGNDKRPLTTAERKQQNQKQEARRLSQYSPAAGGRDNKTARSSADRSKDNSFKDNETHVVSGDNRSDIVHRQPRVMEKIKTADDSSNITATSRSINKGTKTKEKQILANNTDSKHSDLTNKNRNRDKTISTRDEKRKQDAAKQSSGRQHQRENIKQSKIVQYQPIIAGQRYVDDNNNDRRPLTTAERRQQSQQKEARRLSQYSPAAGGKDTSLDRINNSFKENETHLVSGDNRSDIVYRQPRTTKNNGQNPVGSETTKDVNHRPTQYQPIFSKNLDELETKQANQNLEAPKNKGNKQPTQYQNALRKGQNKDKNDVNELNSRKTQTAINNNRNDKLKIAGKDKRGDRTVLSVISNQEKNKIRDNKNTSDNISTNEKSLANNAPLTRASLDTKKLSNSAKSDIQKNQEILVVERNVNRTSSPNNNVTDQNGKSNNVTQPSIEILNENIFGKSDGGNNTNNENNSFVYNQSNSTKKSVTSDNNTNNNSSKNGNEQKFASLSPAAGGDSIIIPQYGETPTKIGNLPKVTKLSRRAKECALARHSAKNSKNAAILARACDLECESFLKQSTNKGKRPAACPIENEAISLLDKQLNFVK